MFNLDFFRNLPPVTKNLLILNLLIWITLNAVSPAMNARLIDLGALHYVTSQGFKIWQPVTYMFMHEGFAHFFFNMWALLMFGFIVELTIGSRRFLFYYLGCGIGAAVVQELVFAISVAHYADLLPPMLYADVVDKGWTIMQEGLMYADPTAAKLCMLINGATIGASGAVFGILLAFAMLYPDREMYIMFIPVPVKAKWMVLGYGVLELALGLGNINDNIAHFAHLGGMLFGFLMIYFWKKQARNNGRY